MSCQPNIFASLTRITDLQTRPFQVAAAERARWATGDYVVGEVTQTRRTSLIEVTTGRMTEVAVGDQIVGALGVRAATLEAVGHWRDIPENLSMEAMTAAGIMGRVTSQSTFMPDPVRLRYLGHVHRNGQLVKMSDFVPPSTCETVALGFPVLLLIGTSMSSGKTSSAKVIIRRLKRKGLRVIGAKLTGAGRYHDILAMSDAGADCIFDFVDQGLPSTVCDEAEFRQHLRGLLARIADAQPDVLVAEAGASPLEPYNGDVAVDELGNNVRCTVLSASDPYAVVGVIKGFGFQPDFVSGVATSTSAGVDVIKKLAGTTALNLLDPRSHPELDRLLSRHLNLG